MGCICVFYDNVFDMFKVRSLRCNEWVNILWIYVMNVWMLVREIYR